MQAGVVTGPIERSTAPKQTSGASVPTPPVHDLNVPYEGTEEYETPTAEILFPPVSSLCCFTIPILLIKKKKKLKGCFSFNLLNSCIGFIYRRHCRHQFKHHYQEWGTTLCITFLLDLQSILLHRMVVELLT